MTVNNIPKYINVSFEKLIKILRMSFLLVFNGKDDSEEIKNDSFSFAK